MKKAENFNMEIAEAKQKLADYCERTGQDLKEIEKYCEFMANPLCLNSPEEKAAKFISLIIEIVDIEGDDSKKYYLEHNGRKIYFNELPKGTYYTSAYHGQAGKALYMVFDAKHGTCLTPIYETSTDCIFKDVRRAGEEKNSGKGLTVRFFNHNSL